MGGVDLERRPPARWAGADEALPITEF